jgi:hypothetical protein
MGCADATSHTNGSAIFCADRTSRAPLNAQRVHFDERGRQPHGFPSIAQPVGWPASRPSPTNVNDTDVSGETVRISETGVNVAVFPLSVIVAPDGRDTRVPLGTLIVTVQPDTATEPGLLMVTRPV